MKFFQKIAGGVSGAANKADRLFQKGTDTTNRFFSKTAGQVNKGIGDVNRVVGDVNKGINKAGDVVGGVARQGSKVLGAIGEGLTAATLVAPELAPLTLGLGAAASQGAKALKKVQKVSNQVSSLQAPKIKEVEAPQVTFA
jgi:phage-related tail protein